MKLKTKDNFNSVSFQLRLDNKPVKKTAQPFVKWAGGKSQILHELRRNSPKSYSRYIEPFVGGGAFLFSLAPENAMINDSNAELINCYQVIKTKPEELIQDLRKHENSSNYYYKIRSTNPSQLNKIERASRFIFLNRTCFNGLWRVNKKNEFNTPFGRYKNPRIVNAEQLRNASRFLTSTKIFCMDFEKFILKFARKGDFVYFDPPYHPISKYSDFKRYTKEFFGINDQKRLAQVFKELDKRGCKLLLSNSFSEPILDLYSGYNVKIIHAKRIINKDPAGRSAIKEVLVKNYYDDTN